MWGVMEKVFVPLEDHAGLVSSRHGRWISGGWKFDEEVSEGKQNSQSVVGGEHGAD